MIRFRTVSSIAVLALATVFVRGQQDVPPGYVFHPSQEARVRDLSPQTASSTNATAVLTAELETIFHNVEVCCGKNSALQDAVGAADPSSAKDVGAKLEGKHPLSDGRAIRITAEYEAPGAINPGQIISSLSGNRALLLQWKSRLYVLYGAVFDEKLYYSGQREYIIHKLLLFDLRFSDSRKEVVFDRDTDDWGKVQGLLKVSARMPQ